MREAGGGSGARRVFPLRLARQAVALAGFVAQPVQVTRRLLPCYVGDRKAALSARRLIERGASLRVAVELALGHLEHAHCERLENVHRAHRAFVRRAGLGAHVEAPRGNDRQERALAPGTQRIAQALPRRCVDPLHSHRVLEAARRHRQPSFVASVAEGAGADLESSDGNARPVAHLRRHRSPIRAFAEGNLHPCFFRASRKAQPSEQPLQAHRVAVLAVPHVHREVLAGVAVPRGAHLVAAEGQHHAGTVGFRHVVDRKHGIRRHQGDVQLPERDAFELEGDLGALARQHVHRLGLGLPTKDRRLHFVCLRGDVRQHHRRDLGERLAIERELCAAWIADDLQRAESRGEVRIDAPFVAALHPNPRGRGVMEAMLEAHDHLARAHRVAQRRLADGRAVQQHPRCGRIRVQMQRRRAQHQTRPEPIRVPVRRGDERKRTDGERPPQGRVLHAPSPRLHSIHQAARETIGYRTMPSCADGESASAGSVILARMNQRHQEGT